MNDNSSFLLLIFILLLFSALLSASESALLSSSEIKLKSSKNKIAKLLKKNEDKVLIAIVIWNNIINIFLSLLVGKFFEKIGGTSLGVATAVATFLIVTFGEIIPKSLAVNLKERFLIFISPFIYVLYLVAQPFVIIYYKLIQLITKKRIEKYTEEELKAILHLSLLNNIEKKLVERVLALDSKRVGEILIPKDDVVMISEDAYLKDVLKIIAKTRFSKILTYKNDKDNVTGYINLKDILLFFDNLNREVREVKRRILFVPEYMKVLDLIELFKDNKIPIAAVVDEYGNFLGIVTLTDALEEVFGELRELGEKTKNIQIKVKGKELIVDGDISIEELNTMYNLNLPKGESYNTISGLILYKLGRFPSKGEKVQIGNYLLIVEDVSDRKINKVKIILKG